MAPSFDSFSPSGLARAFGGVLPFVAFLLLLAAFVVARSWGPHQEVFPESGEVRLLGVDSWFHARHAEHAREAFPSLLREDPGARYPNRGRQQVSGLFNLAIGGATILADTVVPGPVSVDAVAAWTPVVLAGLSLVLLYLLAFRLAGLYAAFGACLVFLLFPGTSLQRSLLGFADQHVLEWLLALGTAGGLAVAYRRALGQESESWRPHFLLSLPFAAFFYSWLGAPIYLVPVSVAAGTVILWAASRDDIDTLERLGRASFRFFGAVVLVQLAVMLVAPDLVMALGRGTEWWILGGMVVLAAAPLLYARLVAWTKPVAEGGPDRRLIVAVTLLGLALALWLFVEFVPKGRFFFNQLTHVRGNQVAEQGDILWVDLWVRFGVPGLLAAVVIPVLVLDRWRGKLTEEAFVGQMTVCVFGVAVALIWLRTHDFDYAPPIFVALLAGLCACRIACWLGEVLESWRFLPRRAIEVGVIVLFLAPWGLTYPIAASSELARGMVRHKAAWFEAAEWLRTRTPPVSPTPTGQVVAGGLSYGVMTAWDDGNFVAHVAKRLPTLSRFPGARDGRWLTARSEGESLIPICPQCESDQAVRYVVVSAEHASTLFVSKAMSAGTPPDLQIEGFWQYPGLQVNRYTFGPAHSESLARRLVVDGGLGLERYKLVYQSEERALLFTLQQAGSPTVVLSWTPLESPIAQEIIRAAAGGPIALISGGYAYDFATVPQVQVFELIPPVGAEVAERLDIPAPNG